MNNWIDTIDGGPAFGRSVRKLASAIGTAPGRMVVRMVDLCLTWQMRSLERQQLRSLSEHTLKDIGLSRADTVREADKPFWRG